jgi:hypothetical protein
MLDSIPTAVEAAGHATNLATDLHSLTTYLSFLWNVRMIALSNPCIVIG